MDENPGSYMEFLRFYVQSALEFGSFLLKTNEIEDQVGWLNKAIGSIMKQLSSTSFNKVEIITTDQINHPLFDNKIAKNSFVYLPSIKGIAQ